MGHVPATVIVGAQWGDEGKGKIVDLLAQDSDIVCRYQGGPNAGHTIVVGDETFKIRQIPSGVIRGKTCVIGAGCVLDPEVFLGEVDELEARGHSTSDVHVSGETHLIMLDRFHWIVEGLVVYPERMRRNLAASHGLFFSHRLLLALIESGLPRDDAYRAVQAHAMRAWEKETDFTELVRADRELASRVDLDAVFDLDATIRHVDTVFDRLHSLIRKEEPVHA